MGDTRQLNPSLHRDQRLMSLDALGFDMFWIIGGVPVIKAAAELTGWSWLVWLSGQMHNTEWHGFTFYDFTAQYFFDGVIANSGIYKPLLWAISVMSVEWLFLLLLYKKHIFVRV